MNKPEPKDWRKVAVVSDTGWQDARTSIPRRGINDFERFIQYPLDMTQEAIDDDLMTIYENYNPGYCGWSARKVGDNLFRLTSTWDSSD